MPARQNDRSRIAQTSGRFNPVDLARRLFSRSIVIFSSAGSLALV
jgi:hypothetical protein